MKKALRLKPMFCTIALFLFLMMLVPVSVNAQLRSCIMDQDCGANEECIGRYCLCPMATEENDVCVNEVGEYCCDGGGCKNLNTDSDNCGACGDYCDAGEVCRYGQCMVECQSWLTRF